MSSFDSKVTASILAFVTGDALGVPVEFRSRAALSEHPVTGMRGFGTYGKPKGTWSDDSSMTLCTLESLAETGAPDFDDVMRRFLSWLNAAHLTADDETFDVGISTRQALSQYEGRTPALQCGGTEFSENGNGSLMRVLPAAFWLFRHMDEHFNQLPAAYETIHNFSRLTHAHPVSLIACGFYCSVADELLLGKDIPTAVADGIAAARKYYRSKIEFTPHLTHFSRVSAAKLAACGEQTIKSTGYVLHTLEASLWCLLHTDSLKDCLLKAVNLGDDSDTTAAVTGGLAGIAYGADAIPTDWLDAIVRRDRVESLISAFLSHC